MDNERREMNLYTIAQSGDMVVLHGDTEGKVTNDDVDDALCFWVDKNLTPEQYLVTWDWTQVSGGVTVLAEIGEWELRHGTVHTEDHTRE